MRWILLLASVMLHTVVISQATLKIFVAIEDIRSDMDIIDLNTSSLDRYGQSVDSTNTNYYTTTMSTQVLRMTRLELFGPEEETTLDEKELDKNNGGTSETYSDLESNSEISADKDQNQAEANVQDVRTANTYHKKEVIDNGPTQRSRIASSRSTRSKPKHRGVKKSKKIKKYRGQCPKFF